MEEQVLSKNKSVVKTKKQTRYVRVDRVVEFEKSGWVKSKDQSFNGISGSGAVQAAIKNNGDLVLMEK